MPNAIAVNQYSAKTVVAVNVLKDIRRWLINNCKNRWSATDYKGYDFNWRKLGKVDSWEQKYLAEMDITIMVHFKKPEDLMLYLLSWPSEVLLND
ncbi:hypothetical protein UFOVP71_405 [uncultured Caudovirales phage]|uniref:Uncharacterized protein n=1 Tax=uncultured Caudovirales phage TaxID=2100421 RepID=A0A6J5TD63_9CAUD|nr:hypothetical protein UFOVP71_405 [uncultured Caudovirales phage]